MKRTPFHPGFQFRRLGKKEENPPVGVTRLNFFNAGTGVGAASPGGVHGDLALRNIA